MNIRRSLATVGVSVALASASLGVAAPAQAASPVVTGGLVNVTIVDLVDISNVVVQVPIAAAVNICNVDVAILLAQITPTNPTANCTATASSRANR